MKRYFIALVLAGLALAAGAQERKRIERAADLPRFTYEVDGKLEDVVRDAKAFSRFAAQVRRDNVSVLATHDIADKAARRQLMTVVALIDYLEGRLDDAEKMSLEIRALEDKPADRLVSGLQLRAMIAAQRETGSNAGAAYVADLSRRLAAELKALPYAVVENDIKGSKSSADLLGEALVLGNVRDRLQPVVDKAGGKLSSDLAPGVVGARYSLVARLPAKAAVVQAYSAYLAANRVEKADIWKAREAALPAGAAASPVRIAVWDSGVDASLFPGRVVAGDAGEPAFIAFDRFSEPSRLQLMPIPDPLRSKLPEMKARTKGLSDLRSNVDSPEAAEVKKLLSTLKREEYKPVIEEISLAGSYSHGTHVAGIAMEGNPYARLVNLRIEFDYRLLPDPCPTKELEEKTNRNYQAYVDFLKRHQVRVVNMSWGGSVRGWERGLELCNIGNDPAERKAMAREYFDRAKSALTAAFASAPEILFVTSAGNSNEDSTFAEAIPSSIVLPNLLTVGAVDKAGDEAPFTSYGPTVKVHANGYQVESYLPGGDRVALSGTSMSSPQVTNLAAKLLAVNPKLTPVELIGIITSTAEKTADGRRTLVHPARALEAARKAKA